MKRNLFIFFAFAALALSGCSKNNDTQNSPEDGQQFGEKTELGKQLNNPYALENMQAVSKGPLEANFLYVRFLPEDDMDIFLLQQKDLHLYEYPLDYELNVIGRSYHDPSVPEDKPTWQYAIVPADFDFPDVTYEKLEECYIPENNRALEEAAFLHAGYELPESVKSGDDDARLSITLSIKSDFSGSPAEGEGVKGVKVYWRSFVKEISGYTDEYGKCSISNDFISYPELSVTFDNINDFSIWENIHCINAVSMNLGFQKAADKSLTLSYGDDCWSLGIINNSAYDYYASCREDSVQLPPSDLKIWAWTFVGSSSASMIRRVNGYEGGKITSLAKALIDTLSQKAGKDLEQVLPDLTVGTAYCNRQGYDGSRYRIMYKATWHELTHASHYSQAGDDVWAKYIDYIVKYGAYGTGVVRSEEDREGMNICDLGESWAYSNERYLQILKFNQNRDTLGDEWFAAHYISIFNILNQGVLTRKQMFDCLTPDVKSYADFANALISTYDSKKEELQRLLQLPE